MGKETTIVKVERKVYNCHYNDCASKSEKLLINLLGFLFHFLRNETYRMYFDFRVNYLNSKVVWPIKTEFVIENLNIYEM